MLTTGLTAAGRTTRGVIHWDQPLEPGGEACLVTSAPLMKLLPEAEGVEVSLTAGSYVCNQVYYQALRDYSKELACLFIHVTDQQTVEDQATWVRSVLLKLTLSE